MPNTLEDMFPAVWAPKFMTAGWQPVFFRTPWSPKAGNQQVPFNKGEHLTYFMEEFLLCLR